MDIISILSIVILFTLSIFSIVLIGILISEIFERKNGRRNIFYFLFFYFLILGRMIFDAYLTFFNSSVSIFAKFDLFFSTILLIPMITIFFFLWKQLDKRIISFNVLVITIIFIINFLMPFSYNLYFGIVNIISIAFVNFGFYFLTIKFLIDTSEDKK